MDRLQDRRALIEDRLKAVVDGVDPDTLETGVAHATLSPGKRVRPLVTVLVCEALGGDVDDALDFAVGIELVHSASLVVDDIIDRSARRRGDSSAWATFGHGEAIITSDGLLGEAFALFSSDPRAMQVVAEAMIELGVGEATELTAQPTDEASYLTLARRKTGALFRAAAALGAIAADADPITVEAVGEYAEEVGIAFQIRDDVLDTTATTAALGKPAGQDAVLDRPSVLHVTDLTPAEATDRARHHADQALAAIERTDLADTEAKEYLLELAGFVVERER